MTRIYVAVAAAFLAAAVLSAPAAQACISCNYTPEVVNTPLPGDKAKKRATAKKEQSKPAKKRVVKQAPPAKAPPAKAPVATEPPAAAAAQEADTQTANSSSDQEASPRSGTATTAFAERDAASAVAATGGAEEEVGCKRYSAEARATVTVPCE